LALFEKEVTMPTPFQVLAASFNAVAFGLTLTACFVPPAPAALPPAPKPVVDPYALPGDCRKVHDGFKLLACTAYFEAGNQPFIGQVAVALTVVKRVRDPRFPDTIYQVVWQKKPVIQYDWTVDPRIKSAVVHDREEWRVAVDAAALAVDTSINARVLTTKCDLNSLISYHERHIQVNWPGLKPACTIADHIFYREIRQH
jgi:hypothetical protein